jgi:hypothetical protein
MHVLDANELFWITSYTYDRIMEVWWKQWPDAFALYFKLMKQARIQQTNQTYSLNSFLKDGMWWWTDRLRNAKNILKNLWLVDDVNLQDEKWKIIAHYVRVNYLIDEEKVRTSGMTYNLSTCWLWPQMDENHQWVPTTCGWTATNALSTKYINALSTQNKIHIPFETFWKEFPHARKGKKAESKKYYEQLDTNEVMKQVQILKRKIKAWLQDWQYIPACERWIRDFTPLNDDVVKQDLVRICKRHLNAEWDMKQRSQELKQTFWDEQINKIVKAIQQQNSPKNLFIKP